MSSDLTPNDFSKLMDFDIRTLNSNQYLVFNRFLIKFVNKMETISATINDYLVPIYLRIYNGIYRSSEFDKNRAEELESLTMLFNSISKKKIFITSQYNRFWHSFVFQELGSVLTSLLKKQQSHKLDTSLDAYFNAASASIRNRLFLDTNYPSIPRSLFNLGKTCFSVKHCNHTLAFDKILGVLGDMTYSLDAENISNASKQIIQQVLVFQKEAAQQLNPNQTRQASYLFLKKAYPELNASIINSKFKEMFPNYVHLQREPIIIQPSIPANNSFIFNSTSSTENSSSILLATEKKEGTFLKNLTDHPTKSTTSINRQNSYLLGKINIHFTHKLAGGAIVGFGLGIKDELLEALGNTFLNTAVEKNYSVLAINSIKTTFWFINSFSSAAIPLLYSYICNMMLIDEEKNSLNSSQLIISTSICFSLEALCSATYLLAESSRFKKALNYIKFFLVFSFLFATSENTPENTMVLMTSATASALAKKITKVLTNTTKGTFFKKNKPNNLNEGVKLLSTSLSENAVSRIVRHSDTSSNAEIVSSGSSSNSNRSYYFLTNETLSELQKELSSIEKNLKEFLDNCTTKIVKLTHVIETEDDSTRKLTFQANLISMEAEAYLVNEILNKKIITIQPKSLSQLEAIVENLNHSMHQKACKGFTSEIDIASDHDIECSNSFLNQIKKDLEALKAQLIIHSKHELIRMVVNSITSISNKISVSSEVLAHKKTALQAQNSKVNSEVIIRNTNSLCESKKPAALPDHFKTDDNRRYSSRF